MLMYLGMFTNTAMNILAHTALLLEQDHRDFWEAHLHSLVLPCVRLSLGQQLVTRAWSDPWAMRQHLIFHFA